MTITPHMSGKNTGYGEVLQFASFTPNIGPYMEYKGGMKQSARWYGTKLKQENGTITIPEGPGLGLQLEAKFIAKAKRVKV